MRRTLSIAAAAGLLAAAIPAFAQGPYTPPPASLPVVDGIDFASGEPTGEKYRARFDECDAGNTCDGKPLRYSCRNDPNRNHALLRLKDRVVFYDAKMGLDADGSPYARNTPGQTDQAETSFRYPLPGKPSVDADKVPYVAIPGGGFAGDLGVETGDVAAVVHRDKVVYALVADIGPACKIGEGSIQLHERLGHKVCTARNVKGECTKLSDNSIERDVLYFVFPGSHKDITSGLTPANVDERIAATGQRLFDRLRNAGR
ncbi:MAG TPA: glycoside hydrolase family 75 protein [Stellaceae bacterium]|jgi:hypothetical protein